MVAISAVILNNVTDPKQRKNPYYLPYIVEHITSFL